MIKTRGFRWFRCLKSEKHRLQEDEIALFVQAPLKVWPDGNGEKMIGDNPTIFGAQTVDQGRLRDGDLTYERPRTENRPSSFRHSTSWYIVVSRRMPRDLMWKRRRAGHNVFTAIFVGSPVCPWACNICPNRTIYIIVLQRNTWLVSGIPTPAKQFLLPAILLNTPFSPLFLFELLQFQIKMLKFRVVNGFRSWSLSIRKYFFEMFILLSFTSSNR